MRTTVEITDAQRAQLLRLAAERGEKGFSGLIREALELYLSHQRERRAAISRALATRGSLAGRDADALRASIHALRESWR